MLRLTAPRYHTRRQRDLRQTTSHLSQGHPHPSRTSRPSGTSRPSTRPHPSTQTHPSTRARHRLVLHRCTLRRGARWARARRRDDAAKHCQSVSNPAPKRKCFVVNHSPSCHRLLAPSLSRLFARGYGAVVPEPSAVLPNLGRRSRAVAFSRMTPSPVSSVGQEAPRPPVGEVRRGTTDHHSLAAAPGPADAAARVARRARIADDFTAQSADGKVYARR
jgi:hypothetical protein